MEKLVNNDEDILSRLDPPRPVTLLPDEQSRADIVTDLDNTLFVSAGAGTGKTSSMVGRIVALVASGKARISSIAAITFTDAAANELRERVRTSFEESVRKGTISASVLGELDEAVISTIHSFAKRILATFPIEAGLPPELSIMDDAEAERDLDVRWKHHVDELLEDESFKPAMLRALSVGFDRLGRLRNLLSDLLKHYDRTEAWLHDSKIIDQPATTDASPFSRVTTLAVTSIARELETLIDHMSHACSYKSYCKDSSDYLYQHLEYLSSELDRIRSAPDENSALAMLSNAKNYACARGNKNAWSCGIEEVRDSTREVEVQRSNLLRQTREEATKYLLYRIGSLAHAIVQERAAEGRLCFHDLLIMTRDLLKNNPDVRSAVRDRYSHILIDEFQDTDPLQAEIALLLASSERIEPESDAAGGIALDRGDRKSSSLPPLDPGKLFFVGDAKQSIYRFRRADVGLFNYISHLADKKVDLQANFRSVPTIVRWVNELFSSLMKDTDISYSPLIPTRDELPTGAGPAVTVFGCSHQKTAEEIRTIEATETVELISRIISCKWQVARSLPGSNQRSLPDPNQAEIRTADSMPSPWQAATWKDIAILIPTRTWLPSLTTALEEANIPYRIEAASLMWNTQTITDLLAIMNAVCNPGDPLATLAALRSPYLACGDDDIVAFRQGGGRLDLSQPLSTTVDKDKESPIATGPVVKGLAKLEQLSKLRFRYGPSGLLTHILSELNGYELALVSKQPREHWQQLRWLLEQARKFELEVSRSIHEFLVWANYQAEKGYQSPPGPLEPDNNAISILTAHGAKGLEFPIVILMGLYANGSSTQLGLLWDENSTPLTKLGELESKGYREAVATEKELNELERLRLTYVSMTRARDHLVVSAHHPDNSSFRDGPSLAAVLLDHCRNESSESIDIVDLSKELQESAQELQESAKPLEQLNAQVSYDQELYDNQGSGNDGRAAELDELVSTRSDWWKRRVRIVEESQRFPALTATTIAERAFQDTSYSAASSAQGEDNITNRTSSTSPVMKPPDTAPAIGTAVHSVLHHIDLAAPDKLHSLATAYAIEEGIPKNANTIEKLVRAAVESKVVQEALRNPHWKEVYVAAPIDTSHGRVIVDGYIDLLYKTPDNELIIVDYKTDSFSSEEGLNKLVNKYGIQTAAYALALQNSIHYRVKKSILLFINHQPIVPVEIPDLAELTSKVVKLIDELNGL